MFIIKHRIWFFLLSVLVVASALGALFVYGLHLSTEFTGGSLVEVTYAERPAPDTVSAALDEAGFEGYSVRQAGEHGYIVRSASLSADERAGLPALLAPGSITQVTDIGPTIGAELRRKAVWAVGLVLLCILLFIAFAFRKVSQPISSWVYGAAAIVALVHNVIITTGFFALLGHIAGAELDSLFVTAILTVLGFSVHDTIVVFDRVRENLYRNHERGRKEPFADVAGRSLAQTFTRSVNTSFTVLVTLAVLYVVGPASTKFFSLTLLVGIVAGTYSSIFLATPLLVSYDHWKHR
jgi:preprotein translocase subunit SecF